MSLTGETLSTDRSSDESIGTTERRDLTRPSLVAETISPEAWDLFASSFDGVVQEQTFAYAAARWPNSKKEALLFRLGPEIIGGVLVVVQALPLRLGAIAVCKWGPVFRDAGRADAHTLYGSMIDALVAEYATKRGIMLSVLPRAGTIAHSWQFDELMDRRFVRGSALLYPNRYFVRVGLSDVEQRRSLGQKWRYHLGKAEHTELSFELGEAERLGEFEALYAAMSDRKNFPELAAYETVAPLFAAEAAALRPKLFFVRHRGEVVAGAIIFTASDTAVYLFGATNDKALPLRAGYFLHWQIIGWLRDNTRAKWYDLGGTDGFLGLHQFKKGMVGSAGAISPVPPVANYAVRWQVLALGSLAFAARTVLHRSRWHLGNWLGHRAKPDQPRPKRGQVL